MKRFAVLLSGLLALGCASTAAAQTDVGGSVPSSLALTLGDPTGFARLPAGPARRELRVRARVTTTVAGSGLGVVDGDAVRGRRHGRLARGAAVLRRPLAARLGASGWASLASPLEPLLTAWPRPVANERAVVLLRQQVLAGERPRGSWAKTLLVTLAAEAGVAPAAGAGAASVAATPPGAVALSPAIVDRAARAGASEVVTVTNGTQRRLAVTVAPRPWRQARSGALAADRTRTLRGVSVDAGEFALAPGASRAVTVWLARAPGAGSVYGALDVQARRARPAGTGLTLGHRLVAGLRFDPAEAGRRLALRAGGLRAAGGALRLAVRNRGNDAAAVGGRVRLSGGRGGRSLSVTPVRILPGKLVDVRLAALRGLRPGRYRVSVTLTQRGRKQLAVTRRVRVR